MQEQYTNDNKRTNGGIEQTENQQNRTCTDSSSSGLQQLCDHRDDLRDIADSDLPIAWVADALLDVANDIDRNPDRYGGFGTGGGDSE